MNARNDVYDYVHVETLVSNDDLVTLGTYIHSKDGGYVLSTSETLETTDYALDEAGSALAVVFVGAMQLPAWTFVTGTLAASLTSGLMLVDVKFSSTASPTVAPVEVATIAPSVASGKISI